MNNLEQLARRHRESRRSRQHRRPRAFVGCAATEFARVPSADFATSPAANFAAFSVSDFVATSPAANPTGTLRGAGGSPQSGTGVPPVNPQPAPTPYRARASRPLGEVGIGGGNSAPAFYKGNPASAARNTGGTPVPLLQPLPVGDAFLSHLAARRFPSAILALLAALAAFAFLVVAPNTATACGISWSMPSTPFASDGSYRFEYWTNELGSVRVADKSTALTARPATPVASASAKGKSGSSAAPAAAPSPAPAAPFDLPLYIGFNPASNYNSPLGYGFEFPIFDSRLVWTKDNSVQMYLPDGHVEKLSYNAQKKTLRGSGWLGQYDVRKNQAVMQANCNWVLTFTNNRLTSLRSPDGVTLTIIRKPGGAFQLLRGTTALVTLAPDWNADAKKFYNLKYGDKKAILRLATRPAIVSEAGKTESISNVVALSAIEKENSQPKRFVIGKDSFTDGGRLCKWNPENGSLSEENGIKIEVVKIQGVRGIQRTNEQGQTSFFGYFVGLGRSVRKDYDSPDISVTEYINPGRSTMRPRIIYKIKPNGEKQIYRQYWHDENSKTIRVMFQEKGKYLYLSKMGNEIRILDAERSLLKKMLVDEQERVIAIEDDARKLEFSYKGDKVFTKLTKEGKTIEKEIPGDFLAGLLLNFALPPQR